MTQVGDKLKFSGQAPSIYKDEVYELKVVVSDGFKEIDATFNMNFTDSPP